MLPVRRQLFRPAASWLASVDYHLHVSQVAGRIEKRCWAQTLARIRPGLLRKKRQQRPEVRSRPRGRVGVSKAAVVCVRSCSLPGTLKLAPFTGQ